MKMPPMFFFVGAAYDKGRPVIKTTRRGRAAQCGDDHAGLIAVFMTKSWRGDRIAPWAEQSVDRKRSSASCNKGRETGEVQEIGLIARLSELRARSRHSDQLDRAEAIGQVYRE